MEAPMSAWLSLFPEYLLCPITVRAGIIPGIFPAKIMPGQCQNGSSERRCHLHSRNDVDAAERAG
jgi:hypothetical protein